MNVNKLIISCFVNSIKYKVLFTKGKNNLTKIVKANLALSFLWTSGKTDNIEKPIVRETISSTLEMADKMYESGKYEECYNFLNNCEDLNNIEVKWRICRAIYNMIQEDGYDKNLRQALIFEAHEIIENELNNNWDNSCAQKWYALVLDAKSTFEGRKQKLEQLGTIKKHMDLAAELNPNDAGLLHMLGELCYQVLEIPWHQRITIEFMYLKLPNYTYEDALEYFLKAETAQPRFYSINLLRIGCCYLKINKQDQAKYYLKLAASYPAKLNYDHQAKRDAADLLKKINSKIYYYCLNTSLHI